MVHETIQYSQELSGEAQETCHRVQKSSLDPNVTVLNATKYASMPLWSLGLYCNLTNSDFLKYQEASNLSCTRFLEPQADFLDP